MLLIQTQVLNVHPAYAQQTESKPLPSDNSYKHDVPLCKRYIVLQPNLQGTSKRKLFCSCFTDL